MRRANDFSRLEIKQIAEEYANNPVSRSHFVKKYMISKSTFYTILDKAVIEHIVSYNTVINIQNRAISNKAIKIGREFDQRSIINHYKTLISKREIFLFTKQKRVKILKDFAYRDLSISKEEFCDLNVISVKLLDKILIQSVIYDEISKKLYKKIQSNSLNTSSNYSSFILFMLLEEFRCRANSGESLNINDVYNSIFNTIKKYISNPETVLRQLSFDVKDGELVIK